MQIQHVLVNCFHCFHQHHCSVAGTLPSPVLFGGAFLHISWTMLLKDEIEKRTLRRYNDDQPWTETHEDNNYENS